MDGQRKPFDRTRPSDEAITKPNARLGALLLVAFSMMLVLVICFVSCLALVATGGRPSKWLSVMRPQSVHSYGFRKRLLVSDGLLLPPPVRRLPVLTERKGREHYHLIAYLSLSNAARTGSVDRDAVPCNMSVSHHHHHHASEVPARSESLPFSALWRYSFLVVPR